MRHPLLLPATVILFAAFSGPLQVAEAQAPSELAGGWIVTSWTNADGETNDNPQRGLFVFAESGHYSIMYVLGNEARPTYSGDTQTEAERLSAYASLVANSGRYRVNGNVLTYEAYVANDPNYMADFSANEPPGNGVEVELSITDGILTLHWLGGRSEGQRATFRRPGSGE